MLATIKHLFFAELTLLLRRSQEWLYPLSFFVIVISLFPLAITPDPELLKKIMPGGVWITALLANLLAIENIFFMDLEEGYLEQLVLSTIPLPISLLIKITAYWCISTLPLILLTPLIGVSFNIPLQAILVLCVSLLLGTPILILISSFCVALTLGLKQQGVLLSLLALPLIIPVVIFGVILVQQSMASLTLTGPLLFLAGLLVLAITIFPWVIAAIVRLSLAD